MLNLQAQTDTLLREYEKLQPLLEIEGPTSFNSVREKGLRMFREFGIPTTKDEEFKYLPLHALSAQEFKFGYGATVVRSEIEALTLGDLEALTLVFINGQFAPEVSSVDTLPTGVVVATLADAYDSFSEEIDKNLGQIATLQGKLGSTNDERFIALNSAYLSQGAFVHIAKNVTCEVPIHVMFITKTDDKFHMVFPRLLVVVEENAEAKLIETYASLGGDAFTCPVTEISVAKSARFEHTKYQNETANSIHIANTFVNQETSSVYTSNAINFGAKIARNDINAWVGGEHCETWLNSANVATDEQIIDNHTRIDHAVPNCQSFEVYKSILKDHGVGVFNGKIFVYEDAQKTDAKQTNQAILLSPTATMNTKPQLEIFADDVKCTHGATIGQLREEALFYLRARGIPKAEAQSLLVYAFAAEVLEKITTEPVRVALEDALYQKLA